jgi:hypothetical protein
MTKKRAYWSRGDHYHVVENTPGYLPDDDDPPIFGSAKAAGEYAYELAESLRESGYKVRGNQRDGYYGERDADDLGRVIEIMPCSDPACLADRDKQ